ncbi:MAG TPA: hypothetical protein VG034_29420, partial [Acidimicrobiia bacterium]|nr:hypothetical protein [Acidimicrobiia bacterium]
MAGKAEPADPAEERGEGRAAHAGHRRRQAEDQDQRHVGVGPERRQRHRRVGQAPQQPAEPAALDEDHDQRAGQGQRQQDVVVPDVGGEPRRPRCGQLLADTEHVALRVEELRQEDPEAQRRQPEVEAGEPDGRHGDE